MGRFIKRAQWCLARGSCTCLSKKNYASDPGDFQKKNKNYQPLLDCFFFLATNYSIVVTSVLHSFELQEFSRVLHIAVYEQGDIFCKQQNLSLFSELLRELAASTTQLVNLLQLAVRAKSPLAVGTYMS
jgi:hypothetical protein